MTDDVNVAPGAPYQASSTFQVEREPSLAMSTRQTVKPLDAVPFTRECKFRCALLGFATSTETLPVDLAGTPANMEVNFWFQRHRIPSNNYAAILDAGSSRFQYRPYRILTRAQPQIRLGAMRLSIFAIR